MKTFLEICSLDESYDIEKENNLKWVHHMKHGPHKLDVVYLKDDPKKENYDVHFFVNGKLHTDKGFRMPGLYTGKSVLYSVGRSVGKFIKLRPINKLSISANSKKKHVVFGSFMQKLAKRHKARLESDEYTHSLHFDKDK